jgi:hypothetical protein
MEKSNFDWASYFSELLKIGLPFATLMVAAIIYFLKNVDKLIDKRLERQNKRYEKMLEISTTLTKNALECCNNIIKGSPRIKDALQNMPNSDDGNSVVIHENLQLIEDNIRGLRMVVDNSDRDFMAMHTWKTNVFFLLAMQGKVADDKFDELKRNILVQYPTHMEATSKLVSRLLK